MDENEIRAVMRAWAGELAPLGSAAEVWEHTVALLRVKAGPWPPGVFEIRAYVKRRLEHEKSMNPRLSPPEPLDEKSDGNGGRFNEIRKILARKGNGK